METKLLVSEASGGLRYICSDMWKAYLNVIAEEAKGALHILLDRFHIMAKMNKAIDEVRPRKPSGCRRTATSRC